MSISYKEQLRDRRWQIKRNKILERDKYECQNKNCKHKPDNTILLHVHHLDYIEDKMAWDYPDDMLITLCEKCHDSEQLRPKEEKYLLNTLRMRGFLLCDLLALSTKIEIDKGFTATLLKVLRDYQNG